VTYDSLSLSEVIPARPERIYAAWLSSDEHTAFTGDKAVVEPFVGGKHSAFDGYAVGQTVELQPGRRIVQTWRAEDFPLGSPDSRVEVTLEETMGGTMVTILHTDIPSGQGSSYRDGWLKYYLEPLKGYFVATPARANGVPTHAPKVKATAVATAKPKAKAKARTKPKKPATKIKARVKPRKPKPSARRTGGAKSAKSVGKTKSRTARAMRKKPVAKKKR